MLKKYYELKAFDRYLVVITIIGGLSALLRIYETGLFMFIANESIMYVTGTLFILFKMKYQYNDRNITFLRANGINLLKSNWGKILIQFISFSLLMLLSTAINEVQLPLILLGLLSILIMILNLYANSLSSYVGLAFGIIPVIIKNENAVYVYLMFGLLVLIYLGVKVVYKK